MPATEPPVPVRPGRPEVRTTREREPRQAAGPADPAAPAPRSFLTQQTMRDTAHWMRWFAETWKQEYPTRLHSSDIAPDGSPRWHPDFEKWLTQDGRPRRPSGDASLRTTKVMRRLRRVAVREYEVLYRVLVHGERLEETTQWLNQRAIRNGVPMPPHRPGGPHYTQRDTLALIVAGISYAKQYW